MLGQEKGFLSVFQFIKFILKAVDVQMEHKYPIGILLPFSQERIKFLLSAIVDCHILPGFKLCTLHLIWIILKKKLICIVSFGSYYFFILKEK